MNTSDVKCSLVGVKIASRCNINCTYCYMYNKGDETYIAKPKVMSEEIMDALFKKIRAHCIRHDIELFKFGLHGGEPMLAGKAFIRRFVQKARAVLSPEIRASFSIQTNGMLLTEEWCNLFAELNIGIGISLDGSQAANDKFRIDHKGRGTYHRVVKGLRVAQNSDALKQKRNSPTLLSVVNLSVDPLAEFEHFKNLGVKAVDFGLPDFTYDDPPPSIDPAIDPLKRRETPYGDWLIRLFDQWFDEGSQVNIRLFRGIINLILGKKVSYDQIGTEKLEVLVIETDGSIETLDVLRICGNGFTREGINVLTHNLDDALQSRLSSIYHFSKQKLCKQCNVCPVKEICGGGYIPHRYSRKNGFNNPSIYCADLLRLITHIQNRVLAEFPESVVAESGVEVLSFEKARGIIDERVRFADEPDYVSELEEFKVSMG
jgi:uncharacterized protein